MRDRQLELELQRVRIHLRARRDIRLIAVAVAIVVAGTIALIATSKNHGATVVKPGDPAVEASARTAEVRADAVAGLAKQRDALRSRCWEPSAARTPSPTSVTLTFDLTFDASGAQIASGISEDRARHRADVTECVRARFAPLRVRAPGTPIRVFVPLTLP